MKPFCLILFILACIDCSAVAQINDSIDADAFRYRLKTFSAFGLQHPMEVDFAPLKQAVMESKDLAASPVLKAQTLRVVNEMISFKEYVSSTTANLANHVSRKTALDSRSQEQIQQDEGARAKRAVSSRQQSAEQTIAMALDLVRRSNVLAQFSAQDPVLVTMDGIQKKFEADKIAAAHEAQLKASMETIEITQVVKGGALVTFPNHDYKRGFLAGPLDSNLAEGQTYRVPIERDGVFSYTTVMGAPSTIEKWKIIQ